MDIDSKSYRVLVCKGCNSAYQQSSLSKQEELHCPQCDKTLFKPKIHSLQMAIALLLTGCILFIVSHTFPFLTLSLNSSEQQSVTILEGVFALSLGGQEILAFLVFLTIFLYPLLELLGLAYVFIPTAFHKKPPKQASVLKILLKIRPWNMLEVFFLGVLVSLVKLAHLADVMPGEAIYAFVTLIAILLLIQWWVTEHEMWRYINKNNIYQLTEELGEKKESSLNKRFLSGDMIACKTCNALHSKSLIKATKKCQRCNEKLELVSDIDLRPAVACLITAIILYIPANILPFMYTTTLGVSQGDTLLSGAYRLLLQGDWLLALVIFLASIAVPVLKLVVTTVLIWQLYKNKVSEHFLDHNRSVSATKSHRWLELIGRWSMIDIFVLTLLVALVQFGGIANIQPGYGALAFGVVVVFTMLSVESLQERWFWIKQ